MMKGPVFRPFFCMLHQAVLDDIAPVLSFFMECGVYGWAPASVIGMAA